MDILSGSIWPATKGRGCRAASYMLAFYSNVNVRKINKMEQCLKFTLNSI